MPAAHVAAMLVVKLCELGNEMAQVSATENNELGEVVCSQFSAPDVMRV